MYGNTLNPDEIRILRPTASTKHGEIHCTLEVLRTGDEHLPTPLYYALSYAWGNCKVPKKRITCNGLDVRVSATLHAALLQIWTRWPDAQLWVDAICINQKSNEDRNCGVAKMFSIYCKAARVIVWLGKSNKDTARVFSYMHEWGCSILGRNDPRVRGQYREMVRGDEPTAEQVVDIIRRPWMRRAWTYQEVCLAQNAIVLCGECEMDWTIFLSSLAELGSTIVDIELLDAMAGLDPLNAPLNEQVHTFTSRLCHIWRRHASDPRDKVFSVLGFLTKSGEAGLSADYTLSVEATFIKAARTCLNLDGLSKLFRLAGAAPDPKEHSPAHSWMFSSREEDGSRSQLFLPSWVPDWRETGTRLDVGREPYPRGGNEIPPRFRLPSVARFLGCSELVNLDINDTSPLLTAKGFCVGRLSTAENVLVELPQCVDSLGTTFQLPDILGQKSNMPHSEMHQVMEVLEQHDRNECECKVSESRTLGRLASGWALKSGDWVCVLYGSDHFLVLRPHDHAKRLDLSKESATEQDMTGEKSGESGLFIMIQPWMDSKKLLAFIEDGGVGNVLDCGAGDVLDGDRLNTFGMRCLGGDFVLC